MRVYSKIKYLILFSALSFCLTACSSGDESGKQPSANKSTYQLEQGQTITIPAFEAKDGYVTPELFGAKGDGTTDDSEALLYALNSGYPVEFKSDYYTSIQLESCVEELTIKGNNHTLRIASSDELQAALFINHAKKAVLDDLRIVSEHENKPVDVGSHQALPDQKSSNTWGLRIADCSDVSIQNLYTENLMYDVFVKRTSDITLKNWTSVNTLMGVYTDETQNFTISDYSITLDPVNTFSGCHAFYLCFGCDNVTIENGSMIFENQSMYQLTPVFTCHTTGNQGPDMKNISVKNAEIKGQWLVQVSNSSTPVLFDQCSMNTYYPKDAIPSENIGQINAECDADFSNCSFTLDTFDYGFYNGITDGSKLKLENCTVKAKSGGGRILFAGQSSAIECLNTSIEWDGPLLYSGKGLNHHFENCVINSKAPYLFSANSSSPNETMISKCTIDLSDGVIFDNDPASAATYHLESCVVPDPSIITNVQGNNIIVQ